MQYIRYAALFPKPGLHAARCNSPPRVEAACKYPTDLLHWASSLLEAYLRWMSFRNHTSRVGLFFCKYQSSTTRPSLKSTDCFTRIQLSISVSSKYDNHRNIVSEHVQDFIMSLRTLFSTPFRPAFFLSSILQQISKSSFVVTFGIATTFKGL